MVEVCGRVAVGHCALLYHTAPAMLNGAERMKKAGASVVGIGGSWYCTHTVEVCEVGALSIIANILYCK